METVDFTPNYDESTLEPTVLPTRIPNLIVNGSNGIAVGMATNIPPHNLTEVINATIEMINNPQAGLIDVLKHVHGPDFPTGGFLYGRSGIAQAYSTGRGKFLIRAKVSTENLTKEKQAIIVSEIPYQVNKMKLIERIAELYHEKVIDDITDVRDESDRDGMRIVIELRRGAEAQIVLNQLYKHTQMQESFSMIFLAVVNGQPKELPLHVAIQHFIDHRVDVVRRRTAYLLRKAREREHILEGYKIALDNLDRVIRIIRGSGSRAEARENLRTWSLGTEIVINLDKDTTNLNIAPGHELPADRRRSRTAALPPHPALDRRAAQGTGRKFARTSPSTNRSLPRRRSCVRSSSPNWRQSRSSMAMSVVRRLSTRAPNFSLKT